MTSRLDKKGKGYFFNQSRVSLSDLDNLVFPGMKHNYALAFYAPPLLFSTDMQYLFSFDLQNPPSYKS